MPDQNKICQDCHLSCVSGFCTVGATSTNCTKCSTLFLNSTNSCVDSNSCS